MASKLLNIRMDEEMLTELKVVCGELNISVTDAIKTFSKKLIKDRNLNLEEEEILKARDGIEFFKELVEICDKEEYEKMNEFIGDTINEYFVELRKIVLQEEIFKDIPNLIENTKKLIKEYKLKNGEEFKNKITDRISEFFELYVKKQYDSIMKQYNEQKAINEDIKKSKYEDIMENLKEKEPELYKQLLDKYSYEIDYIDLIVFDFKDYNDAKNKLRETMSDEEIKEYFRYHKKINSLKTKEEKEKFINELKNDEYKINILKSAFEKIDTFKENK